MSWLGRVWKDPVGSKVIASIIISLGAALYAVFNWESVKNTAFDIYNFQVSIVWLVISTIIVLLFVNIRNYYKTKAPKKSKYELDKEFLKSITKTEIKDLDITLRWTTLFDAGHPKPYDIKAYCNKHQMPILIPREYNYCIDDNCPNHEQELFNYGGAEPYIQTLLDANWYKLVDNTK